MGLIRPSDTAMKYLLEHVKSLSEEELPIGSHLRSRRVLEGLRGHKQCRKDLAEIFDKYYGEKRNALKVELRPETCSGVNDSQITRHQKPGAGLGWTEPRKENVIGFVDIRKNCKDTLEESRLEIQCLLTFRTIEWFSLERILTKN